MSLKEKHKHGQDECACGHDVTHEHHCECHNHVSNKHKEIKHCDHHHLEDHSHGGCDCCHNTKVSLEGEEHSKNKRDIIVMYVLLGLAVILAVTAYFININIVSVILYVIAYLLTGYRYIIEAIKHIAKGKIFDENFLMCIASIGAMAIGEYVEAIAVMALYGIGESMQNMAVMRSKRSIRSLLSLKVNKSVKLVGEEYVDIDTDSVDLGDVLLIRKGARVPVDGIILNNEGGCFDKSVLTGESIPVNLNMGDEVQAGSINVGETLTIKVTRKYTHTNIAKIIKIVEESQENKPRSEKMVTVFAKYYTPIVVGIALIVAIIPSLITGMWAEYINKALVFLVISCPCAIVISVPLAIFSGVGGASRNGILVKGGNYLEEINNIDVVAFDKTGTLTKGTFDVLEVVTEEKIDREKMLDIVSAIEEMSSHPIAKSITMYHKSNIGAAEISSFSEYTGQGVSAMYNNDVYYIGNSKLMKRNNIEIRDINSAKTILYVAQNSKLIGYFVIGDAIREDSKELIEYLKAKGKKILMLTGDNESVAEEVASKLGIDDYRAEMLPVDKEKEVEKLIESGKKVMFVGDGINDAPVMASSNIGVCVEKSDNDISIEAGDIILSQGKMTAVKTAFGIARKTKRIIVENIVMSLLIKIIIAIIDMTVFPSMWLAVVADVGVSIIAILNSVRALNVK